MKKSFIALFVLAAGCGAPSAPMPRVTGRLELSTFPTPAPSGVQAIGDDGDVRNAAVAKDGTFELGLRPDDTYVFRVTFEAGGGYPVALPRIGHFDRGLVTGGRVEARLGTVWLPPASSDVTRVLERDAATCVDGHLEDGTACAVLEAFVSCADGPSRPTDDPSELLLGTGTLGDLPGPGRYALPSNVPPPILWDCPPPQLP